MQRIFIFGPPGSGKSTLAQKLAREKGLPLFHLDKFFFKAPKIFVSPEDGMKELKLVLPQEEWIVEGNYWAALEFLASRATQCIILNISPWRCLFRVVKRHIEKDPVLKTAISEGFDERLTWNFTWFILYHFPKSFKKHINEIKAACRGIVEIRNS